MKRNLQFLALPLCFLIFHPALFAQSTVVVVLKLRYVDSRPLPGKDIKIYDSGRILIQKGKTDQNGNFSALLMRGLNGTIEFSEAGYGWSFKLNVPQDQELNVFEKTCKISIGGVAVAEDTTHRVSASATIHLHNSNGEAIPEKYISVYDRYDVFMKDIKTDEAGTAVFRGYQNETYKLLCNIYGAESIVTFMIPETDNFTYDFVIQE